jgi:hypothetical protein
MFERCNFLITTQEDATGRNFSHQPLPAPCIRSQRRHGFEIYNDGLCSDIYCSKHPHPRRVTFDRYSDRKRKRRQCPNTSQNCGTNRITTTTSETSLNLSHITGCPRSCANGLRHPILFFLVLARRR